jgi:hypothetical protein
LESKLNANFSPIVFAGLTRNPLSFVFAKPQAEAIQSVEARCIAPLPCAVRFFVFDSGVCHTPLLTRDAITKIKTIILEITVLTINRLIFFNKY